MKLTSHDALELAKCFRETAKSVGDYLYGHWNDLPAADRSRLRSIDVTLINVSTDLVTHAVGITIEDGMASLAELRAATARAADTFGRIRDVKIAIAIATALIGLAAAVPTGNPAAIAGSIQSLQQSIVKANG